MVQVLLILSVLGVLLGLWNATEATFGVALIATAGVIAVWARIAQATEQHKRLASPKQEETVPTD